MSITVETAARVAKLARIKVDPASNTIVSKTAYKQLIATAEAQTSIPAGKGTDFIWRTLSSGLLRISRRNR